MQIKTTSTDSNFFKAEVVLHQRREMWKEVVVERGKERRKIVGSIHSQADLGMKKQNIVRNYLQLLLAWDEQDIPSHIVVSHLQIHPS